MKRKNKHSTAPKVAAIGFAKKKQRRVNDTYLNDQEEQWGDFSERSKRRGRILTHCRSGFEALEFKI